MTASQEGRVRSGSGAYATDLRLDDHALGFTVLDLATGREVLSPGWHWVYDGSSYQTRYGSFGLTLGERRNVDVSKALFFVRKPGGSTRGMRRPGVPPALTVPQVSSAQDPK